MDDELLERCVTPLVELKHPFEKGENFFGQRRWSDLADFFTLMLDGEFRYDIYNNVWRPIILYYKELGVIGEVFESRTYIRVKVEEPEILESMVAYLELFSK